MAWTFLAASDSFDTFGDDVTEDMELPKGTRICITMDLKLPVGYFFNLPGAEYLFRPVMPEGVELIDVHDNGAWGVIVEGEVDPAWLIPLLTSIKFWAGISLFAIGIAFALGMITSWIRGDAQFPGPGIRDIVKWGAIGTIAVLGIKFLSERRREKEARG